MKTSHKGIDNILDDFDYDTNIWELYPQMKILFKDVHSQDSSQNKSRSSQIMYAIALVYHPASYLKNMLIEDRKLEVEKNYLKRKYQFNWDTYTWEINRMIELTHTKPKKFLARWEADLEARMNFISSIEYSAETPIKLMELKESMMKDTSKMWDQYMNCLKQVEEEEATTRGDEVESLSDSNQI